MILPGLLLTPFEVEGLGDFFFVFLVCEVPGSRCPACFTTFFEDFFPSSAASAAAAAAAAGAVVVAVVAAVFDIGGFFLEAFWNRTLSL